MQYIFSIVVLVIVLLAGGLYVNRPQLVAVDGPLPAGFPDDSFSHDAFEAQLRTYVGARGNVDYDRWFESAESVAALNAYLVAVSRFSPDNSPERFPDRNAELAYWMYGYNAYVIKSVLDHWPISSVTDVKAPLEAVTGLGFFYRQRFLFGGESMSLLTVENDRIRKRYRDPRIHFILSCASGSCPIVRPELPTGAALEEQLTNAAMEFVSDPENVSIDHANRQITLSRIFKWYKADFVNYSRLHGFPDSEDAVDYILSIVPESPGREFSEVGGYEVRYHDYDWSLNSS